MDTVTDKNQSGAVLQLQDQTEERSSIATASAAAITWVDRMGGDSLPVIYC